MMPGCSTVIDFYDNIKKYHGIPVTKQASS